MAHALSPREPRSSLPITKKTRRKVIAQISIFAVMVYAAWVTYVLAGSTYLKNHHVSYVFIAVTCSVGLYVVLKLVSSFIDVVKRRYYPECDLCTRRAWSDISLGAYKTDVPDHELVEALESDDYDADRVVIVRVPTCGRHRHLATNLAEIMLRVELMKREPDVAAEVWDHALNNTIRPMINDALTQAANGNAMTKPVAVSVPHKTENDENADYDDLDDIERRDAEIRKYWPKPRPGELS